jgi:hypothetical protein
LLLNKLIINRPSLKDGLLDIHNFVRHFNQIKTHKEKENLLNQLLFYATATTVDFRNTIACDILVFMLMENVRHIQKAYSWQLHFFFIIKERSKFKMEVNTSSIL